MPRTRLWIGWIAGLGCFIPGLFWAHSFNVYGAGLLMAFEALSMSFAGFLTPNSRDYTSSDSSGHNPSNINLLSKLARPATFVSAFSVSEAVRMTWPFGGLPIGGVFLGQASSPLLNSARIGGPLLLTALVWALGAGLSILMVPLIKVARGSLYSDPLQPTLSRSNLLVGVYIVLLVVGLCVAGWLSPEGHPTGRELSVASVQGGGKRGFSKEQVNPETVFAAQLSATSQIPTLDHSHTPDLILWPEDVISLAGQLQGSWQANVMSNLASSMHTTIVAGVTSTISSTSFLNEAVVWGPNGKIIGHYEKVHRVPFGEYVPYRGFFKHFANLSAVPLDAVPGHGTGLLDTPAGALGTMISFEVFFANRSLPSVRAGAQVLIVPTNTSSYATTQIPTQEVAADKIQAVQTGRYLIQAAPAGYSTVVNDQGKVLDQSVLDHRQVLLARVPLLTGSTIFVRIGQWPILGLMIFILILGWIQPIRHRTKKRS